MKIVISGSIGSGKSTQIKHLQDEFQNHASVQIIPEAVDEWIKDGWLQKFYSDQKKYSLGFQFRVLQSQINLPNIDGLTIIERSPHTTVEIFSKQLTEDGMVTQEGYKSILNFAEYNNWEPTCFIYIQTPPEICHQRILERSRDAESTISLEYLQNLHQKHEEFHQKQEYQHYMIDGTQSKDKVFYEIMQILYTRLLDPYQECLPSVVDDQEDLTQLGMLLPQMSK